jgi:hypothetical protein
VNVAVIALTVGRACNLDEEQLHILGLGALLHDIGKLEVDWDIINKPGQLTDAEFEEIKRHPQSGADIVSQMDGITREVIDIVLGHHVHFNRDGYPTDVRQQATSPLVDMAAIADTYDAMTTLRSYQRPVPPSEAAKRLREIAGSVLNPEMVEKFIQFLGPWPAGTLVRLDNNQIALVTWVGLGREKALRLKVLLDEDGQFLKELPEIELSGTGLARVVAEVDPFVKGITVCDYLYRLHAQIPWRPRAGAASSLTLERESLSKGSSNGSPSATPMAPIALIALQTRASSGDFRTDPR